MTAIIIGTISISMMLFLEESKFNRVQPDNTNDSQTDRRIVDLPHDDAKIHLTETSTSADSAELYRTQSVPIDHSIPVSSYWQRLSLFKARSRFSFRTFLPLYYRPVVVLYKFPGVLIPALIYGFYIAATNVLAVMQTTLYALPPYNFGTLGVAEMNVPPAIGAVLGSLFGGLFNDRAILFFAKRNKGVYEPEMRLWLVAVPAVSMLIGILMFGLPIAQVCLLLLRTFRVSAWTDV